MNEQRKFNVPKGILVPRDSRQIYAPVEDNGERVVSDLIPTSAITGTFPELGVTTYGECAWINDAAFNDFKDYVLRSMQREGSWWTRLFFSRVMTDEEKEEPYRSYQTSQLIYWDSVLEDKLEIIEDVNIPQRVKDADDNEVKIPSFYAKFRFFPGQEVLTPVKVEMFLSDVAPNVNRNIDYDTPQPTPLQTQLPGFSIDIPKCLHTRHELRTTTNDQQFENDPPAYQVFPATNVTDWVDRIISDDWEKQDVLWVRTRRTALAPARGQAQTRLS